MTDLNARIADAIARVKASRAADEVLDEINRDHVILDRATVATYLESLGWRDVYHGDAGPFLDALFRAGMPMDDVRERVQFWEPPVRVVLRENKGEES